MPLTTLKKQIEAIEKSLGVSVTIHDYSGYWLNNEINESGKRPDYLKHSHEWCRFKRQEKGEFDQACLAHCSQQTWQYFQENSTPRWIECWKGVLELQVPMLRDGVLLGALFIGSFKARQKAPPESLKKDQMYHSLTVLSEDKKREIYEMAIAFATAWVYLFDGLPDTESDLKNRLGTWLQLHSKEHLSLQDLADQMNLSTSRAGKVFKQLFGMTFTQVINKVRIENSKMLLKSTRLGLSEIARSVGFENEYYFGRVFKKQMNLSPGRFRRENAQHKF